MNSIVSRGRRTAAEVALTAGLLLAAAGVLTQYLTGVPGFPPVPPGPFILAVGAAVTWCVPGRGGPAIGMLVAMFISAGALIAGQGDRLTTPSEPGQFAGTWLTLLGLLLALCGGLGWFARAAGEVAGRTRGRAGVG